MENPAEGLRIEPGPGSEVDPGEERRERFKRLAEARTNVVLDKIRILAHCSNKYAYEYGDADVEKIFSTIEGELKRAKQKFMGEQRTRFRLDSDS